MIGEESTLSRRHLFRLHSMFDSSSNVAEVGMNDKRRRFRGAATGLLLALLISACGGDNDGADAARANVDAMSKEHANDDASSNEATALGPANTVISQTLPYTEFEDELVYGYFAAPADMFEPLPAIIMIHEWWGLNDNIRAMADRLAGEGYVVFAVDMYGGQVAETPEKARELMLSVVENPESGRSNLTAAYEFLDGTVGAPKIGSMGWCFGGGWSLNAAQLFPDSLDASVIYYGQVTADEELLRPVSAPILGLFGADDRGIPVDSVEAFRSSLERLRKTHEVEIYPGVGHAFANPSGRNYDAQTADVAWQKTLDFLDTHLASDGAVTDE